MIKDLCFIVIGFFLLIIGAEALVKGSSNLAKKFHIPEIIIGLTIVCIGTSTPELFITVSSALKGYTDLIVGNAIGSNLCNLLLILAIAAILKPVKIDKDIKNIHLPVAIFATILVLIIGNISIGSGKFIIGRNEGIILLVLFIIYFAYPVIVAVKDIIKVEHQKRKPRQDISVIKSIFFIIIGILMLKYGGDYVVDACEEIAITFGISERVIGLTIVAIGTALPELITTIIATLQKDTALAVGNLIGSCMLNLWLILGLGAVITPLVFSIDFNLNLVYLTFGTLLIWLFCYFGKKNTITSANGLILLFMFLIYFARLFIV